MIKTHYINGKALGETLEESGCKKEWIADQSKVNDSIHKFSREWLSRLINYSRPKGRVNEELFLHLITIINEERKIIKLPEVQPEDYIISEEEYLSQRKQHKNKDNASNNSLQYDIKNSTANENPKTLTNDLSLKIAEKIIESLILQIDSIAEENGELRIQYLCKEKVKGLFLEFKLDKKKMTKEIYFKDSEDLINQLSRGNNTSLGSMTLKQYGSEVIAIPLHKLLILCKGLRILPSAILHDKATETRKIRTIEANYINYTA